MFYFLGAVTHNSTGIKTIPVGFPALGYRLIVGPKAGGSSFVAESKGVTNGTFQFCDSSYSDPNRSNTNPRYNDRMVFIQEWDNGTSAYVTRVRANHNSITTTEIKYDVITANVSYQFLIEAWG